MSDLVMQAMCRPITAKPIFAIGQKVRVHSRIDVNMPSSLSYWLGAKCEVIRLIPRGLLTKEWAYELRHPAGHVCEFKAEELDKRYKIKSQGDDHAGS